MSIDVNLLKFLSSFGGKSVSENLQKMEALNGNGDGTLLKQEFMDAVHENARLIDVNDWNGESTNQRDLIDKWWKSLDTIQSEKKIEGTNGKFNEINALSKTEIENFTAKVGEIDWDAFVAETRKDTSSSSISDIKGTFTVDLKPLLEAEEHYTKTALETLFGDSYELSKENAEGFTAAVKQAILNNYRACLNADKTIDYDKLDVAILNDVTDNYFNKPDHSILDKMDREDISGLYKTRVDKIDSFDDANSSGDVRAAADDCLTQIYDQYDSEALDAILDKVFGTHDIDEISVKVQKDNIDTVRTGMNSLLEDLLNDETLAVKPPVGYTINASNKNVSMYTGGNTVSSQYDFTIQRRVGSREKEKVSATNIKAEIVGDSLGSEAKLVDGGVVIKSGDTAGTVTVRVTITAPDGTKASYTITAVIKEVEKPKEPETTNNTGDRTTGGPNRTVTKAEDDSSDNSTDRSSNNNRTVRQSSDTNNSRVDNWVPNRQVNGITSRGTRDSNSTAYSGSSSTRSVSSSSSSSSSSRSASNSSGSSPSRLSSGSSSSSSRSATNSSSSSSSSRSSSNSSGSSPSRVSSGSSSGSSHAASVVSRR